MLIEKSNDSPTSTSESPPPAGDDHHVQTNDTDGTTTIDPASGKVSDQKRSSSSDRQHAQKKCNSNKSSRSGKPLMNISAFSMQGKRAHMEDYFDIGYQMKPADMQRPGEWPYEYFYFGIFDGHGGCEAAKFAKENLLRFITRQVGFWSDDDEDVKQAIRIGFAATHEAMRTRLSTWNRANKVLPSTAGTTASVLFIKNGKFYSGHVGDSRIVISKVHPETKQWISEQVTNDHKPESEKEIQRIERAGGEVKSKMGVHRVVWRRPVFKKDFGSILTETPAHPDYYDSLQQISSYPLTESLIDSYQVIPFLAIARSLGDFWSINPYSGQYIVSPEPDVTCRPVEKQDKCILLATDGLWNVMNSPQAVRILQELKVVKKGRRDNSHYSDQYFVTDNFYDVSLPQNDKNHALSLVYIAYQIWERRRQRSDNITAIVAMISDILPPQQIRTTPRRLVKHQSVDIVKAPHKSQYIDSNTIQLKQTHIFCESVCSDIRPKFYAKPKTDKERNILEKIEELLVLPPTVYNYASQYMTAPKNYMRLSNAECRMLMQSDEHWADNEIYIKSVSDDPADEVGLPSRKNKRNVVVRDASAQASQPIHDFGQPWDQLLVDDDRYCRRDSLDDRVRVEDDISIMTVEELRASTFKETCRRTLENVEMFDIYFDDEEEEKGNERRDESDDDLDDSDEYESTDEETDEDEEDEDQRVEDVDDEDEEGVDDVEVALDVDIDLDVGVKLDELVKGMVSQPSIEQQIQPVKEQDKTISQLRCLMNQSETPLSRRTTRSGAYLSVTENPKRKTNPNPDLPKAKRRTSHPVPSCALART